ncbi:hypothetical protein GX563_08675 [Candidatus Bathyarchaeota archaeon]|nr:hypothetical protein [Candidatus Bathyarchaeota archaeon]
MLEFMVFVAAAFSLLAALAYIRSMFKGHAKPNRVTWLMWSVAPFVATAASVSMGADLAAVPVFMAGFAPFMIFVASFLSKEAYWKLSPFDYACGAFSALAVILWFLTNDPILAIVLSIIADALAAAPTVIKAWHEPKTESIWPFLIGTLSPFTSFLAASTWSFSELSFPSYLISINLLLVYLILRR